MPPLDGAAWSAQNNSVNAAILYGQLFSDTQKLADVQQRLGEQFSRPFKYWSRSVELMLEADPKHPSLDEFRTSLVNQRTVRGENDWLLWLLDLRRGKKAEAPPPLDSLAIALRHDNADAWLRGIGDSGEVLWKYLNSLRDPYIFITGSGTSPRSTLQFLGVLDRLELSHAHAK